MRSWIQSSIFRQIHTLTGSLWNLRRPLLLVALLFVQIRKIKNWHWTGWVVSMETLKNLKLHETASIRKKLFCESSAGIIGPWYGVSTAVSYDPDIIFVLSGNTAAFSPQEVPNSHYSRLGINPQSIRSAPSDINLNKSPQVSDLTRQTAFKWLSSIEPVSKLPSNPTEVEEIALKRLGLWGVSTTSSGGMDIPWKKFLNFPHWS